MSRVVAYLVAGIPLMVVMVVFGLLSMLYSLPAAVIVWAATSAWAGEMIHRYVGQRPDTSEKGD